jgi:hypothetical protein
MMASFGEPQFVAINTAAGDTTLVAAQAAGVKIRVLGFLLVAAAAAVVSFQSGTGGTALSGPMTLATGVEIDTAGMPFGVFETAAATLLNLHQTGAVQLSGFLIWAPVS